MFVQAMKHVPGMRILFSPMSPMGALLGTTWWNPGLEWNWKRRATGESYIHRFPKTSTFISRQAMATVSMT